MKCQKCGEKAVLKMPQHNMGMCKRDFLAWIPEQTERFITKYAMFTHQEKILLAVSGGKDSLSLWDILLRLGYQADGLYIALGIDGGVGYSAESQRLCMEFAERRDLKLHIADVKEQTGRTLPQWAESTKRGRGKPCSLCGLIKRHEMNRIARDLGYDVLATGHNLDDEAAVLLGNTLTWDADHLLRQGPVLPEAPGLARKVKPLCRIYEREMTAYALLQGIDYIYEECPYSRDASSLLYKDLLNQAENRSPGTKLSFYLKFLEVRRNGSFIHKDEIRPELHPCTLCGQPTSAPDLCSFCRLVQSAKDC